MIGSGDYISREAAIEAMYKDAEAHQDHTFWTTQHEALLNIPAADVLPRWIGVKERLPESSGHYLVCIECKCDGELLISWMQVALFYEKFYWEYQYGDDIFNETVTHWMPLPEPPEEVSQK